jgi:tripeptide aminopeptidase
LIEFENFNAASAVVRFTGVSVHPGYAKNIMVNAQKLAMLFHSMLPENEVPECTAGREGFYHLTGSSGSTGSAELRYILRDHDPDMLEKRKAVMREAQKRIASVYGENSVALEIKDQYRNMIEVMKDHPFLVEIAKEAIADAGLEVVCEPIRGGTDGARLCFMGLPCPNIGHGGYNPHGEREYTVIEEMESAVQVVLGIIRRFAMRQKER